MDSKFKDRQHFNDRVVFAFICLAILATFGGLVKTLWTGEATLMTSLIYLGVILALGGWLWWLRHLELKVSIDRKRIKYKMAPWHSKSKRIAWKEVASCKVVKTPLAAQWHGSNIHFCRENWFSLSGRNGLSLLTRDGEQYFIGCRDVEGLADFLKEKTPADSASAMQPAEV